jgi:hypothetical protein
MARKYFNIKKKQQTFNARQLHLSFSLNFILETAVFFPQKQIYNLSLKIKAGFHCPVLV